jgi:hypothetical protein
MNAHLDELINRWREGKLSDEELRRLTDALATQEGRAALRGDWFLEAALPEALRTTRVLKLAQKLDPMVTSQTRTWTNWLSWRPLTAAAAGIVFGMFCTSIVFAYVAPLGGKVITLFQESFESGPAPLVTGVPIEADKWSGDYTEVVGEQQGVKPASGKKVLSFLRGDYEGRNIPSSHSSDVFRLLDVRPYRREFADGGAVVQLTAVFNAVPFPADENFSATLTIFALDASLVGNETVKAENALSTESLAFSRSSKVVMDRNSATWQKVSNELRLTSGTEFLMIRIGMSNDTKSKDKRRDSFAGHFADKVQLVIARRPEITVP